MRPFIAAVISLFVISLPVFAQRKAKEPAAAPMTDQQFVDFAGQTDMTEANLGQVAQEKGGDQAVKDYGQMLRTDHTGDYDALTAAAGKAMLDVPKGIDAEHNRMIDSLNKLKGAAFDRRFAHAMVEGHEHAVAAYTKEAQDAQSADLKSYAEQALPVLEKHLDDAKKLEAPHHK
jgi:putative membrane protein